jgi:hypothetical protein
MIRADPTPPHADSTSVVGRCSSWGAADARQESAKACTAECASTGHHDRHQKRTHANQGAHHEDHHQRRDHRRPTLALRRRSIRTLTTDELRGVHGGNTSPSAATSNGPTGGPSIRQDGTITPGTSIIRQSGNSGSGTSVIKRAPQSPSQ